MKKCDCYKERETIHYLTEYEKGWRDAMAMTMKDYSKKAPHCEKRMVGYCIGQKNCPDCSCEGDRSKCDAGYFKEKTNGI